MLFRSNKFMFELNEVLNHENSTEGGMAVKIEEEKVVDVEVEIEETDFVETEEEVEVIEKEITETEFEEEIEETVEEEEEEETVEDEFTEEVENTELIELQTEYELVKQELEDLKVSYAALVKEKDARDLNEKEEICNKFSILGEEALKSFRENLTNYTAEELEKELSVVAFQKGITFNLLSKNETIVTAAPIKNTEDVPAWVKAVKNKESEEY